ncbi:MAG: hypothetical protein ACKOUT_12555 [Novosphingobium sp.]
MRLILICAALLALAGCKAEPTFDERYDAAQKALDAKSKAIDGELAVAASEGLAADAVASESAAAEN